MAAQVPRPTAKPHERPASAAQKNTVSPEPAAPGGLPVSARPLEPVSEVLGCRIAEPFEVSRIGAVRLEPPALLGAAMVPALAAWVGTVLQPAARLHLGGEVSELAVSASYVCRTRNNTGGAKLSEHAYGNAIDVSGFGMRDGSTIAVETGWTAGPPGETFLKAVHGEACAHFTTVLGPDADTHHRTHFHFDLARRGKTGTYRVCQ